MLIRRDVLAGGLLAGLSVNAFAQSVNTGSRMALVVGNSEYKSVPLKSPARDAAAMAEVLEAAGFAVTQAQNLTDKRFQLMVEEFARKVAANKALGLVYLAGQGMALRGDIRFVGISDQTLVNINDFHRNSSALSWILSTMEVQRKAASLQSPIVLIADISSDEVFQDPGAKPATQQSLSLDARPYSMIWLASAPGTVSEDEESGKHGLFTKHLINALGVPGVALKTLDGFVRTRVRAESKTGQVPWSSFNSDIEQVALNTSGRQAQRPPVPSLTDDPKVRGRSARGG